MKTGKRDGCRFCAHVFDICPECKLAGLKLKEKYRIGLTPGRITAKSRTGSTKGRRTGRKYNTPKPPSSYFG